MSRAGFGKTPKIRQSALRLHDFFPDDPIEFQVRGSMSCLGLVFFLCSLTKKDYQ